MKAANFNSMCCHSKLSQRVGSSQKRSGANRDSLASEYQGSIEDRQKDQAVHRMMRELGLDLRTFENRHTHSHTRNAKKDSPPSEEASLDGPPNKE
jgi:hypothetical protein